MAESEVSKFHHRSTFNNKRKSHKINGKSKPSSNLKSFGRVDPTKNVSENERKFRHCNQFRDIGKAQRKAIAKEKRKIHREKLIKNKLKYFGKLKGGTPKIIAIVPLSPYSNTGKVKKHLLRYCGGSTPTTPTNEVQASIGNQKSNFIIYECSDRNDTFSILDICKIADIVLLICSPKPKNINTNKDKWNDCILGLDDKSKLFCSLIKSVGGGSGTTIYGLYQPKFYKQLNNLQKNNKSQQTKLDPLIKNTFLNYLHHQFGTSNHSKNIRIFHCYDMQQIFRFMHLTKNYNDSNLINSEWKQKRPHLLIQKLNKYDSQNQILEIDGYLRGSIKLNINRPIHITGFGDYLIQQIDGLIKVNNDGQAHEAQNDDGDEDEDDDDDDMVMNFVNDDDNNDNEDDKEYETVTLIKANRESQDKLQALGNLDGLASINDQTIITESELKEIEQERQKRIEKEKLEKQGLSDYNMEWIDNENDNDNEDDMDMDIDMNLDIDNEEQRKFEKEEFAFPDEVETPIHIRAKDKFAQYRGLKQFYKTKWDKFELLPVEYSQIANIRDWKKALKINKLQNIIKEQDKNDDDNKDEMDNKLIECGKKIRMYISGITQEIYDKLSCNFHLKKPLIVWNLLKYENKISVCHYLIQKHNEYNKPIQGLKRYIFDVGFRRFESNPMFSDNSTGNKHLIKKFINDNQFVCATIYGPITFPPINTIIFDKEDPDTICCYGNLLNIDTHRLLIKRKVLTGSAIRVQRRRAVIRYMFWNSDDVNYFKPIDLWTKHGLKGRIEQAIGDKGYMKCFFNGNIKQNDTVCLSLYKRVFPFKDENLFTL